MTDDEGGEDAYGAPAEGGPDPVPPEEAGVDPATMDSADVERLFPILEAATADDPLEPDDQDRLLSVLEAAILDPRPMDSEELDHLLTVLESTIVEQTDPDRREVDGVLSVLETSVDEERSPAGLEGGLLSVLESALLDPASLDRRHRAGSDAAPLLEALGLEVAEDRENDPLEPFLEAFGLERRDDLADLDRERFAGDIDDEDLPGDIESDVDPGDGVEGAETADDDPFRVARLLTAAAQRTTDYSVRSGVRLGAQMARTAATAESPADLLDETRATLLDEFQRLGVDVGQTPDTRDRGQEAGSTAGSAESEESLRERGARLLRKSADVEHDETIHPAYGNVLDDLAPDEARILRLLATEGPQPAVDVRDAGLIPLNSDLLSAGMSMIDERAGLRHKERLSAYLNNLQRLGLVWFSEEPVDDLKRYQVVEAQPAVKDAMDQARNARTDRRSIHLTPFGVDFCRKCLPMDVESEDAAGAFEPPDSD